ncbi:MAG: hypothetical protein JJT78_13430 [Leptospira sp.]|nr:hypothetical protein [Leptospira sp.]
MRKYIFDFTDCLDMVFLNPLKFVSDWDSADLNWKLFSKIAIIGSSLSLAVGSSYISPPYTKGFIVGIVLATIANFLILLILPLILGSVVDYWAQGRARKGNAPMMVSFVGISLAILMLYAPICILFQTLGINGLGGSFLALLLVFIGLALVVSRGVKYIYDIKDKDSIRFSVLALGVSLLYPFLFNFYMTSYILNFTL